MINPETDEHRQYITRTAGHEVKIAGGIHEVVLRSCVEDRWRCTTDRWRTCGACMDRFAGRHNGPATLFFDAKRKRAARQNSYGADMLILCRISEIRNQIHIGSQICAFFEK